MAPAIIELLFSHEFTDASLALKVLMAHAFVFYLTQAYGTPLLAWQFDKGYTVVLAVGAITNIVLNLLLIPHLGIEGAALATLITQLIIGLFLMVLAHKAFGLTHYSLIVRVLGATVVSFILMYGAINLWLIFSELFPLVFLIVIGGSYIFIYTAFSIIFGIINKTDVRSFINEAD